MNQLPDEVLSQILIFASFPGSQYFNLFFVNKRFESLVNCDSFRKQCALQTCLLTIQLYDFPDLTSKDLCNLYAKEQELEEIAEYMSSSPAFNQSDTRLILSIGVRVWHALSMCFHGYEQDQQSGFRFAVVQHMKTQEILPDVVWYLLRFMLWQNYPYARSCFKHLLARCYWPDQSDGPGSTPYDIEVMSTRRIVEFAFMMTTADSHEKVVMVQRHLLTFAARHFCSVQDPDRADRFLEDSVFRERLQWRAFAPKRSPEPVHAIELFCDPSVSGLVCEELARDEELLRLFTKSGETALIELAKVDWREFGELARRSAQHVVETACSGCSEL